MLEKRTDNGWLSVLLEAILLVSVGLSIGFAVVMTIVRASDMGMAAQRPAAEAAGHRPVLLAATAQAE
jgi:NhaP-type Na+/H+ or K+/H+ antiporter